jgi:hypothetical protein
MLSKHTMHAVNVGRSKWIVVDPNGNRRTLYKKSVWPTRADAEKAIVKAYTAQFNFGSIK